MKKVTCFILLAALSAFAGDKPKTLGVKEIERVKLENLQLKAKLTQRVKSEADGNFQRDMNALVEYANEVRKEHGWGDAVQFNVDTLQFVDAPKPAEPAKDAPGATKK